MLRDLFNFQIFAREAFQTGFFTAKGVEAFTVLPLIGTICTAKLSAPW